ncbi:MAG: peptide deformylase [Candidatus Omnitrophica bacterium]|nr:peptide deformylase [Candidatus Omnitrophota bacterium]
MSVLPSIRVFPDPVLRQKSIEVTHFDETLNRLIKGLSKVMESQRHGIGIAAAQIGVLKRVALVDISSRVPGAKRLILINPAILDAKRERNSREGCMSLPDYTGSLIRYDEIVIRYQDMSRRTQTYKAEGLEAICIQHEMDHMSGVLFFDRVSHLKRDLIPRAWRRQAN